MITNHIVRLEEKQRGRQYKDAKASSTSCINARKKRGKTGK